MTLRVGGPVGLALALLAAAGVTGCGLKGPLKMPEASTNVVIRAPGEAPATPPPVAPAPPAKDPDRMPPPPLPGGSTGSPRGG